MHASARGSTRGAQASAKRRIHPAPMASAPGADRRHDRCHVRQLERARRQRRHPSVRDDLRAGDHTDGRRCPHYVLMLQEAVRTGRRARRSPTAQPARPGLRRTRPSSPIDIVQIEPRARPVADLRAVDAQRQRRPATRRKIAAAPFSRRFRLSEPIAVELPGERQRRVVIIAKAGSFSVARRSSRRARRSDSACGCSGRRGCATCRCDRPRRRCRDGPLVVGADLNTWHGRDELAARFLGATVSRDAALGRSAGARTAGPRLHVLSRRRRISARATARCERRYGSDHRPLVGWVE